MNRDEFDALDARVRARAADMWDAAGSPDGGPDRFLQQARELVAMAEVAPGTFDPSVKAVIEEASLQRNLGEFPTLVDQGEEQTYPDETDDDGEIHLSDGDASDSGGVLPSERDIGLDLPEVPESDADITSATLDSEDPGPSPEDLNDDGMPDQPSEQDAADEKDVVGMAGERAGHRPAR